MYEIFSLLEIPTMNKSSFLLTEMFVTGERKKELLEELIEAGKEEKLFAINAMIMMKKCHL